MQPSGRAIETYYSREQLVTAGPGRRLAGALLDGILAACTLGIGWFIWFCFVAGRGQTPGKQLLGMYIIRTDGTRAGGGYTWMRELLVRGIVFPIIALCTLGIVGLLGPLWRLWDRNNQCLWDKIASTYVGHSPHGFRPASGAELFLVGQSLPVARVA